MKVLLPDHKCSSLSNCPQPQILLAPLAFPVPKDISHSLHVVQYSTWVT